MSNNDSAVPSSVIPHGDAVPQGLGATPGCVPTLQALLVVNSDLTEAKAGLAVAIYEEQKAAIELEAARVACEVDICRAAGGEANLGTNEAARKRAIAYELEHCDRYTAARTAHVEAVLDRRLAESDVALAEGQCQALLAALQGRILQVSVDWLLLPGEAHAGRLAPSQTLNEVPLIVLAGSNGNGTAVQPPAHHPA